MKRAALLVLFVGVPLAMLLFPRFRRAVLGRLRLVLLAYAGALLLTGGGQLLSGGTRGTLHTAFAVVGFALLAFSFVLVLIDARRR